jgi:hypothetical protein
VRLSLAVPDGFKLAAVARSHGWYDLPPFAWDERSLHAVVRAGDAIHDVTIVEGEPAAGIGEVAADQRSANAGLIVTVEPGGTALRDELRAIVASMLRLD